MIFPPIYLPQKLVQMTDEAFFKTFNELIKDDRTHKEAYGLMEEMHVRIFHKRRYSSYQSFRQTRSRWIKKQ